MDTSNHEAISEVGEKLLKPALESVNRKSMRISAFYLGNWLTDVSQTVDAVAYARALQKAESIHADLSALFKSMNFDAPSWLPDFVEDTIQDVVDSTLGTVRMRLEGAERKLMAHIRLLLDKGANGKLAEAAHELFHFIGYFKFVNAKDGTTEFRMDPECYDKVFKNRFRVYFPHEHLDRPETKTAGQYESVTATGPLNTSAKKAHPQGSKRDLYLYLREDIKIAAGMLASLDGGSSGDGAVSWAAGTFHEHLTSFTDEQGKPQSIDDTNYEWNRHLALLGHALHAVEDFFAHSSFVEHSSGVLPVEYKRYQNLEEQDTLARRLKTLTPGFKDKGNDWRKLKNDPHVATGYFDTWDTLFSLVHFYEKAFDKPNEKIGAKVDKAIEYDYVKLFEDTLKFCENPTKEWFDPANTPSSDTYDEENTNVAVKQLRESGGHQLRLIEKREELLNQTTAWLVTRGPLKDKPKSVKDSFVNGVLRFGQVGGVAWGGLSLYKSLKSVIDFLKSPLGWLKGELPEAVYEQLKKYGEFYLKDRVLDYLGAKRIGCHTLMAKDTGPELLHAASMECAKLVHWFVVKTLMRHSEERRVKVVRASPGVKARNNVYIWECLDWLELLEFFLNHPFAYTPVKTASWTLSTSVVHITRDDGTTMSPDSLASLAQEYAPTFEPTPNGPAALTWEVIADANFPTRGMSTDQRQKTINRVLKDDNRGLLTQGGINYAFRPGLRLLIPYQRTEVELVIDEASQARWWYTAITKGYGACTYGVPEKNPSEKNLAIPPDFHIRQPASKAELQQLVKDAMALRKKREAAYG